MKKILLASVMTALALPVLATETRTTTVTSPELTTTTTTTETPQKMEEEVAAPVPSRGPTTAPAVDALPHTGAGTLDQQRMEDPAVDAMEPGYINPATGRAQEMQDPSIEDESGEYKPKIDDSDYE